MSFLTAIRGAPFRMARVSFTGDRSYRLRPLMPRKVVARENRRQASRVRRRAFGSRRADDPAGRKGLHRRRQGHRRNDDAPRSRDRRAPRAAQGRVHREAVPVHAGRAGQGPQAAGWPQRRERRSAAADRRDVVAGAGKERRSSATSPRAISALRSAARSPSAWWKRAFRAWPRRLEFTISARSGGPRSPPPSRSIRKGSGSMRETAWAPARRGEGTLVDRPRLTARALTGRGAKLDLGRPRGGDRGACARRAAPRPLCDGAARGACAAYRARPRAARHAGAARGGRRLARRMVRDFGRRRLGGDRRRRSRRAVRAGSGNLRRSRRGLALRRRPVRGLRCLIARTDTGFRLHVESPWLETLLTWLDGA